MVCGCAPGREITTEEREKAETVLAGDFRPMVAGAVLAAQVRACLCALCGLEVLNSLLCLDVVGGDAYQAANRAGREPLAVLLCRLWCAPGSIPWRSGGQQWSRCPATALCQL
jgi:hypothetical protein